MSFNKTWSCKNERNPLFQLAADGNGQALNDLFVSNSSRLYQIALRILCNPHDAEDAVQDGMMCAFRNLAQFQGLAKFSTWLHRIVVNASLMRLRRRRYRPELALDPLSSTDEIVAPAIVPVSTGPDPEAQCACREEHRIISQALLKLPRPYRSVFQICVIEGLSAKEAAERMGVPVSTVKGRLFHARRRLKTTIIRARSAPCLFPAEVHDANRPESEGRARRADSIPVA